MMLASRQRRGMRPCTSTFPIDSSRNIRFRCTDASASVQGDVYRARDTKLGRDVALKVLPEDFSADPERLARFQREAQVLASLNHPNIAAIYGVEENVLVLELVEGPTLAERLAAGPIPLDDFTPSLNAGLFRVSADGGAPEQLTTTDSGEAGYAHVWPQHLPGGQAVLFTIWGDSAVSQRAAVLDLGTRDWNVIRKDTIGASYVATGHLVFFDNQLGTGLLAAPFDAELRAITGPAVQVLPDVFERSGRPRRRHPMASTGAAYSDVEPRGKLGSPRSCRIAARRSQAASRSRQRSNADGLVVGRQDSRLHRDPSGDRLRFVGSSYRWRAEKFAIARSTMI